MRTPDLNELALIDADEAARAYFDGKNYERARRFWILGVGVGFAALAHGLEEPSAVHVAAGAIALLGQALLFVGRRTDAFRRQFSAILVVALAGHAAAWTFLASQPGLVVGLAAFLAAALVVLRLRLSERLAVAVAAVGAAAIRFALSAPEGESAGALGVGELIGVVVFLAFGTLFGFVLTSRARQRFLVDWRRASGRERDRLRMRDEIAGAREIQLALLPRRPPTVAGLEVAAVCIPATEVGGDYFDYFPGGDGVLGVVIGDVAGHGVASGLVLAGVRGALHVLADDLAEAPERVLERLNPVVAAPGGQRLLMTLGLARFDRARSSATWVAAGHPPPLRWSAEERRVETPETSHPPLGTRLPVAPERIERPFRDGDVWLLVSDGALEARRASGEEFGEGELERVFARLAERERRADRILDGLLAEISRFRAGETQEDDLTLVVVRAVSGEAA